MAVAYQTKTPGQKPAGIELFDISMPEKPRSISFFDASGPHSRGVHQLWFCDGEYVHMAAGAADFQPRNRARRPVLSHRRRAQPVEAHRGRALVAARHAEGDNDRRPNATRSPPSTRASARTTPTSIPSSPDRCYLAYLDGGMLIMDISDKSQPKLMSPLGQLAALSPASRTRCCRCSSASCYIVTDESTVDGGRLAEARSGSSTRATRRNPMPDRDLPAAHVRRIRACAAAASARTTCTRTCRLPTSFHSETSSSAPTSTAACVAYDLSNPYQPQEIGRSCRRRPTARRRARSSSTTSSSTSAAIVYTVDRHAGGLYILEATF